MYQLHSCDKCRKSINTTDKDSFTFFKITVHNSSHWTTNKWDEKTKSYTPGYAENGEPKTKILRWDFHTECAPPPEMFPVTSKNEHLLHAAITKLLTGDPQ